MFRSPRQAPTYLSETASFKQYLDYYTQRAGLTENKLALFSRLNQSTLNKIANEKMQNVSVPMLVCICLALGLNEVEAVDLMARRERALSPANETHQLYLDLIRMYSSKEIDYQLSDSTIHNIHSMLHGAMKAAEQTGMIARNPTESVAVPKVDHPSKQILNDEQLGKFMKAIKKDAVWYDFFYTELTTGLRRGEICGLMWQDFDPRKETLEVRRTVHVQKGGGLTTGETKTNQGRRTITLPPSTAKLLRDRKISSCSQWIFPDPIRPERPIPPGRAYTRMKELLKEAGLPSIRFHDLRHTLDTYAHVLNDHKWEGINLMEELYAIHQTPPQNLAYPVVVTPDINGYHFEVPDFPEINFLAPEMDSGVSTVTQTLRDAAASMQFPPAATLATEIPLLPGQFILQIIL